MYVGAVFQSLSIGIRQNGQALIPDKDIAGISGNIICCVQDLAARTTLTALFSALRPYGQTETADRAVTVKEEDYRAG